MPNDIIVAPWSETEDPKQSTPAETTLPEEFRLPSHRGPGGIRFDFNNGCQICIPQDEETWQVRMSDLATGNTVYASTLTPSDGAAEGGYRRVRSAKRFFIKFRIQVWRAGALFFTHDFDATNKGVFVRIPALTLGDTIGWRSYAVKLRAIHRCRLTIGIAEHLIPLFDTAYPDIRFVPFDKTDPGRYYASYTLILFYDDDAQNCQPQDFRLVGLHRTAAYILGVDPAEEPPRLAHADGPRPIAERYVCIAAQATTQCKYWNNPDGWRELVEFLKVSGYRVICIDEKPVHGRDLVWNHIPYGAENQTGRRSLSERALWLRHADFFVGLSSGLSWLAWAAGTPVVLIGGFTEAFNEFHTPYRVINYLACHGCWHDVRHTFDRTDFLYCPRHKGTPRQFECSKSISSAQVKATIRTIPGFPPDRTPSPVIGAE